MKKILMVIAFVMATISANAQQPAGTFTIQPKVGVSASIFSGERTTLLTFEDKARIGFLIGAEGEYMISDIFSLSLGAQYQQQGWKFDITSTEKKVTDEFNLDYVNIPLLANVYFAKGWAVKAGVQLGIKVNSKLNDQEINSDILKSTAVAIPVGVSYELPVGLVLDLRYNLPVNSVIEAEDNNSVYRSLKAKSDVFQFTVGYKFSL